MDTEAARFTDHSIAHATGHISRRGLLTGAARLAAGGTLAALFHDGAYGVAAAQGTPVAATSYPELRVTIVDDPTTGQAFQADTTSIPAGYVLLTAVNQSQDESGVGLVGPRPGETMQDLLQLAATPAATDGFPTFFTQAQVPGGVFVLPGQTSQAVIQVTAGDWALWGGGGTANPDPVFLTATERAATQPEPEASITITEVDFAFGGWGTDIPSGEQTWKVVNAGSQPHMLSLSIVPDGTTLAQVMGSLGPSPSGTPVAGALARTDFRDIGGVLLQSPGTTVWAMLDLPAGHYAALCFMTDPRSGEAHAMEGMAAVFDVR